MHESAHHVVVLLQLRDPAGFSIGDSAPALVPVSQVMMCMNCTSDFSLTLRRHHCHGCGRVSIALVHSSTRDTLHTVADCCCALADCLQELLQEQIPAEIHERSHGQSVWSLLQRAEEERLEHTSSSSSTGHRTVRPGSHWTRKCRKLGTACIRRPS